MEKLLQPHIKHFRINAALLQWQAMPTPAPPWPWTVRHHRGVTAAQLLLLQSEDFTVIRCVWMCLAVAVGWGWDRVGREKSRGREGGAQRLDFSSSTLQPHSVLTSCLGDSTIASCYEYGRSSLSGWQTRMEEGLELELGSASDRRVRVKSQNISVSDLFCLLHVTQLLSDAWREGCGFDSHTGCSRQRCMRAR